MIRVLAGQVGQVVVQRTIRRIRPVTPTSKIFSLANGGRAGR